MKNELSVIIPYYNKRNELPFVLESLVCQTLNSSRWDIVIIDDGSDNKIDTLVSEYQDRLQINLITIPHSGNRAFVRNTGANASNSKRLLFIDCDMILSPDTLEKFDIQTKDKPLKVLLGTRKQLLEFDNKYLKPSIVKEQFDLIKHLYALSDERVIWFDHKKKCGEENIGNWQLLYSHCFCVWKENFLNCGGFDESFGTNWGAEDVELGYRLWITGSTIEYDESIICYHIPHPFDMYTKIDSMKKNYNLFMRKHQHWLVELFIKEYEIIGVGTVEIQKKFIKNEHLLKGDFSDQIESDRNIVLAGVEDLSLIDNPNVTIALLPNSQINNPKVLNVIGVNTLFKDKEFDLALVSEKYLTVNAGIFYSLCNEMRRIAKKVKIINENSLVLKEYSEPQQKLMFIISSSVSENYNSYFFKKLAIAAHRNGILTGIQATDNYYYEINKINHGFLSIDDESDHKILEKIMHHHLNYYAEKIPCIMDGAESQYGINSHGMRILWEELNFSNSECQVIDDLLPKYNHVFVKRNWEKDLYGHVESLHTLQVGIDRDKFLVRPKRNNKKKFNFLWADAFTTNASSIEMIVDVFLKLFKDNSDVTLRIVHTGNYLPFEPSIFLNDECNNSLTKFCAHLKDSCNKRLNSIIEKTAQYDNISIRGNVYGENEFLQELQSCDCYININSSFLINPLVLASVAYGIKPLILNSKTYDGYIDDNHCIKVESDIQTVSTLSEGMIQIPFSSDRSNYLLAPVASKADLYEKIKNIVSNPDRAKIEETVRQKFIDDTNWDTVITKLIKILELIG